MKEINLKKVMMAYNKSENAFINLKQARDYAKMCAGGVYEMKSLEMADSAMNTWKEYSKELDNVLFEVLDNAISDAQGKSRERIICPCDIISDLRDVEEKLGISKQAMDGITVSIDHHAQNFPRAYKYRAQSTRFEAVFKNGSWRITDIRRDDTRRESQKVIVTHTEESKKALLNRFTVWS